ncbi:MAG: transporter [Phycisphaeraceae bacterium]|nr:transporter [Phycisphaeraceae bacterium]
MCPRSIKWALLITVCTAVPAFADDADEHDGPAPLLEELILGESAYTQEQGEFQTTIGFTFDREDDEKQSTLSLEMEYGITDWLQVGFEVPYQWIDTEADGFSDIEFSAAARLFNQDGLTLTAVGELALPTGDEDDELGEGDTAYEAMLLGAWNQGRAEVYGGVGFEFTESDNSEVSYFLAGAIEACDPFALVLELAGEHADGEDEVRLSPGIRMLLSEDSQLILGVPLGISDDAADWGISVKFSIEF